MARTVPANYWGWTLLLFALLPALALFLGGSAFTGETPVAAAIRINALDLERGRSVAGAWRFRPGDDIAWAAPGYDDSGWEAMPVPQRWERGGYPDTGQMAWYRKTLHLSADALQVDSARTQIALSIGEIMSAYEIYAGGRLLGGVGELPPAGEVVYDQQRVYIVPASLVDAQGRLVLALRVWGGSNQAVGLWGGGPFRGEFMLGQFRSLFLKGVIAGLPGLLFCALTLAFGAHHLLIYLRNRGLPAYLWFGLLALDISVYGLMLSQWKFLLPLPFILLKKLEFLAIYLFPALAIQMLWSLIDRRVSRPLRIYQCSFVFWALLVLAVPGHVIHYVSLPLWQCSVLPLFVFAPWVLISEVRAGNREARTILPAVLLFLATCMNDLLIDVVFADGIRLMPFGFIAMLIGMSLSLVNRFTRMYSRLEYEVDKRTAELSDVNSRLVEAARVDPLTGVLNRRGITEEAEGEISRMQRIGTVFSVILADVDFFKRVNDEYGHVCGDHVLKQITDILYRRTREIDRIGRWGGEEFILLLPETDAEGAAVLAEKLREAIATGGIEFRGQHLRITMTFGVSVFCEGDTLDSCIARADTALYHGKKNGRNRVMIGKSSGLSLVN